MKSVLVVDSSSELRATLKDILTLNSYRVIGEAVDIEEAFEKSRFCKPDVIARDITVFLMKEEASFSEISKLHPDSNILILLEKSRIFLIDENIL